MELHNSWIEISKENLIHNVRLHRKIIGKNVKLISVVKSNAYGHGIILISKVLDSLKEVDILATVNLEEAIILRENKIKKPILVLSYYGILENKNELKKQIIYAIKNDISIMVYDMDMLKFFDRVAKSINQKLKIHIKVETGMARIGVPYNEAYEFIKKAKGLKNIDICGLVSHFATTEESNQYFAKFQLTNFKNLISILEKNNLNIPIKHISASAGINLSKENHFDAVRLGISLYGLYASKENETAVSKKMKFFKLKPVLSWKTKIFQIKKIKADTLVGYGCAYRTTKSIKMGLIPVGYFEGLDRRFSNNGNVLVAGKLCRIIGRICMNITMIDISNIKNAQIGDEVVLIGQQLGRELKVDNMAEDIGTINYEFVARLNSCIPRKLI